MGPYKFFRVEDEDSRAQYLGREGLFAEDTDTEVDFDSWDWRLLRQVERHLDWGNRRPSPFISMYCDEGVAYREARRRVRDGKEDVKVYEINMRRTKERREYRDLRCLADGLGFHIPKRALNNSVYEYILLHHIPDDAVVDWTVVDWTDLH